jgi:DNA-binding NtrC family response regulator
MFYRVLIAVPEATTSLAARGLFAQCGFTTTTASTFRQAIDELERSRPDLLAVSIPLGDFNGLHLALRSHALYPDLPVLILGREQDCRQDAEQFDAKYLEASAAPGEVISTAFDLLGGRDPQPVQVPPVGLLPKPKPRRTHAEQMH